MENKELPKEWVNALIYAAAKNAVKAVGTYRSDGNEQPITIDDVILLLRGEDIE